MDQVLLGGIEIAIVIYIVIILFVPKRFRFIVDIVYSLLFVFTGGYILVHDDSTGSPLLGITVLYSGLFILAFGWFWRILLKNQSLKKDNIFLYGKFAFPML